ncbi:hypothetical protein LI328DRAFT_128951 [Trichoderma asperelloides]|nr:hypothetical protein LI328DRAFT_128951 [Trichoderma asperelloides]
MHVVHKPSAASPTPTFRWRAGQWVDFAVDGTGKVCPPLRSHIFFHCSCGAIIAPSVHVHMRARRCRQAFHLNARREPHLPLLALPRFSSPEISFLVWYVRRSKSAKLMSLR